MLPVSLNRFYVKMLRFPPVNISTHFLKVLTNHLGLSAKSKKAHQDVRNSLRRLLVDIDLPRIRVNRHGSSWSMLPTAVQFWESLGLGPLNGSKTLSALCVAPPTSSLRAGVKQFHWLMQDAYMSRQLGEYVEKMLGETAGFYPVNDIQETSDFQHAMMAYRQACIELGTYILPLS